MRIVGVVSSWWFTNTSHAYRGQWHNLKSQYTEIVSYFLLSFSVAHHYWSINLTFKSILWVDIRDIWREPPNNIIKLSSMDLIETLTYNIIKVHAYIQGIFLVLYCRNLCIIIKLWATAGKVDLTSMWNMYEWV